MGTGDPHLDDLHFTGGISRPFFQEIVRLANELQPDVVAVTGDLVDTADCIDWIPDTLGASRAPHGVYAILGNHDLRVKANSADCDKPLPMPASGIWEPPGNKSDRRHAGGCWPETSYRGFDQPRGRSIFRRAKWIGHRYGCCCPTRRINCGGTGEREFDLVLAGHTHGGQIRFPAIGAIMCPSLHGVKYAGGTYYEPPTVMHVSRGLSGLDAVRFFCRPELVRLVLRSPSTRIAPEQAKFTATAGELNNGHETIPSMRREQVGSPD